MKRAQTAIDGKTHVGVIFGGRSTEHEVSLASAVGVLKHIDRKEYGIHAVRIDRDGTWWLLDPNAVMDSVEALAKATGVRVLAGDSALGGLVVIDPGDRALDVVPLDVLFPVLHGPYGEDGTLQGLAALADLPCVGPGVLGSALGMDKILAKQMFFQNDLPSTDFIWFTRKAWEGEKQRIRKAVEEEIGFPCFVKPANAGSSIGISKVDAVDALEAAIDHACDFDRKVLVEQGVDARELECAVLGNDEPVTSVVGEIIPANDFYDYEAKYQDQSSRTEAPAAIDEALSQRIRWMAARAFKALDCCGMSRVDFLLDKKTGDLYLNEINTIPGFTPISMYPQLWEATGTNYTALLGELIELAMERQEDLRRSKMVMT